MKRGALSALDASRRSRPARTNHAVTATVEPPLTRQGSFGWLRAGGPAASSVGWYSHEACLVSDSRSKTCQSRELACRKEIRTWESRGKIARPPTRKSQDLYRDPSATPRVAPARRSAARGSPARILAWDIAIPESAPRGPAACPPNTTLDRCG